MKSKSEKGIVVTQYAPPEFEYEMGEIERVAHIYGKDNPQTFMEEFVRRGKSTGSSDLTEEIWSKLENTDSYDIPLGGWDQVEEMATQVGRDWKTKRQTLESGAPIPMAIILKIGEVYHKVAGNTRLMVERALGLTPKVLIVDMTDFEQTPLA